MERTAPETRPTLASIAREILALYRTLEGKDARDDALICQNLLGNRVRFLRAAADGIVRLDNLTQEQAVDLQETLLDAIALQVATGGRNSVFSPFDIGSYPPWSGKGAACQVA